MSITSSFFSFTNHKYARAYLSKFLSSPKIKIIHYDATKRITFLNWSKFRKFSDHLVAAFVLCTPFSSCSNFFNLPSEYFIFSSFSQISSKTDNMAKTVRFWALISFSRKTFIQKWSRRQHRINIFPVPKYRRKANFKFTLAEYRVRTYTFFCRIFFTFLWN